MNILDLESIIREEVIKVLRDNYGFEPDPAKVQIQPTKKEFEGTYTFVMFPFLKQTGQSPEETGKVVGDQLLERLDVLERYNIVKGFLNLVPASRVWSEMLALIEQDEYYGLSSEKNERIVIEYSSPNTNKPLHLGHLRNNFLGYSLAMVLEANGYEVIKTNLINDRGVHICKSMLAYQKFGNGETPESAGMKGDHLIGSYYVKYEEELKRQAEELEAAGKDKETARKEAPIWQEAQEMLKKWEEGDEETWKLWETMNRWALEGFEETYQKTGVTFDKYYFENDTYQLGKQLVEEGLEKGIFYRKKDQSVWIDLNDKDLGEKLLLRSDGTSVYITQDLGTADLKYRDYQPDWSVYVVGNEQEYHFNVLKEVLRRLERSYAGRIYHLSYGMVDLPHGKMKSREGTVVDADELVEEMIRTAKEKTKELGKIEEFTEEEAQHLYSVLAMGALKYFLLKVEPKKNMQFNPEESISFQGDTGPFIQYTHARLSAVLRKAGDSGVEADTSKFKGLASSEEQESAVVYLLQKFPDVITEACNNMEPSEVARYCYDLSKEFNRFYAELPILTVEDEAVLHFRVTLCSVVARVLRQGMGLLGIELPSRM